MASVSKKAALFEPKSSNSSTNNNKNNNINKKIENKNNSEIVNKNLKSEEKNNIKNNSNNQQAHNFQNILSVFQKKEVNNSNTNNTNNNKNNSNINNNNTNNINTNNINNNSNTNNNKNDFQKRLSMFNSKEVKNNEQKQNDNKKKIEINKKEKENESKTIPLKQNSSNSTFKNENSDKNEKKNNNNNYNNTNTNEGHISNFRNIINQINNSTNDKNNKVNEVRKSQVITSNIIKENKLNDNNNNISNHNLNNNNSNKNNSSTNLNKNNIINTNFNKNNIINNQNKKDENKISNITSSHDKNSNIDNNMNNNINNNIESNLNINKIKEVKVNTEEDIPQPFNKSNTFQIFQKKNSSNISTPINISGDKDEIGEIFLPSNVIPETVLNDTFCMAFFITSFNLENPQIIENSTELSSDCGHKTCTSGTAIKPEIIFRYPKDDTKDFEISELGASICFPNGIKICVDKIENHVKALKNYSSILTNQNGKRYYMMTYHYYIKTKSEELNKNNEYYNSLNGELSDAIKSNEYIYIPHCMSLLSKYPFFNQMEKCLESMRFSLENYKINPSEIYSFITYFIKSIPIPPIGSKLFFPLPYYLDLISINQPFYKDIFIFGDNPIILLEYLSVEEIMIIFRLLIFEQKVLIIGNNYDAISQVTYNLILLLYPLQWVHTYISIMTEKMLKYLQSFLPFFNGMHISLYELTSNILENIKENIFIFDINNHNFEMNTYPDLNSKNIIKKINEIVPQFPKNIYNTMSFGLGVMKSYYDKKKEMKKFDFNNQEEVLPINIKIKEVFMQVFLEILFDYKDYLSLIEGKPIFNINTLIEKRPKSDSNFYKEFTETQLFQMFIQNNPVNVSQNNKTFFEEQLDIYQKCKVKTDFREEYINNHNINCEIYKYYIIDKDILENFDKNNKKKINIKDEFTLADYKKYVKQKYFIYEHYYNDNCILKSNKRVIKNKIVLELNKIADKYNFYIIPNQEFNFEVEKRKKSIRIKNFNKNTQNKIDDKKELSNEEKDDIRENIVDVLTKIFKNEEISDIAENKKLIIDSLSTDYGIDLYTNILYQNNGISNEGSFKFLQDIINNSINKVLKLKTIPKDKKLLYVVKLIKCCQNFKKEENKKLIFLSDILYPKMQKIQILNELEFWKQWALLNINDNKEKEDIDQKWVKSLRNIEETLPKFGFKKTMIYSTLADLSKDNISKEEVFLKYMREVVQNLKIFT